MHDGDCRPWCRRRKLDFRRQPETADVEFVRVNGVVLKNKLSKYSRLAAGGETVLVTDRDRVVADLVHRNPAGAR
jgi:hypothetical protein